MVVAACCYLFVVFVVFCWLFSGKMDGGWVKTSFFLQSCFFAAV